MATTQAKPFSDTTAVATESVEAFNVGDWARLRATLHPNVVYEETGTQRRVEGADAYVRFCQGCNATRGTVPAFLSEVPTPGTPALSDG